MLLIVKKYSWKFDGGYVMNKLVVSVGKKGVLPVLKQPSDF